MKQSIFDKQIEILILKYLLQKNFINKATYSKVREKYKCNGKEVA